MNWRKWFRIIHRDLGYICVGLTIIYSISGIAVNHINDWNPNYVIEKFESKIDPPGNQLSENETAGNILSALSIDKPVNSTFKSGPNELQIFLENHTLTADLLTGIVKQEVVTSRRVFRESNFLHLNHAKNVWTYVADLFALSLIVLAVTGLFLLQGRKGFSGRGKWLTAAGFIIPVIFLIIYF